jgi:chromate transporter
VVGVIGSLALWFTLHMLFAEVHRTSFAGIVTIEMPALASLRVIPALITAAALLLMFALKRGLALTLAACALLGVLARLVY